MKELKEELLPTIKTFKKWLRTGEAKLIQYGRYKKGEYQPTLFRIDGHVYEDANFYAPDYPSPDYCYRLLLKKEKIDIKKIREIVRPHFGGKLTKKYSAGFEKEIAIMEREAKRLGKRLEKDPENVGVALRLAMNPFNTGSENDDLTNKIMINQMVTALKKLYPKPPSIYSYPKPQLTQRWYALSAKKPSRSRRRVEEYIKRFIQEKKK